MSASTTSVASISKGRVIVSRPREERAEIIKKLQTREIDVDLRETVIPGDPWARAEQFTKTIFTAQQLNFILDSWEHFVNQEIERMIPAYNIVLPSGRIYFSSVLRQGPEITPKTAFLRNEDYEMKFFAIPYFLPRAAEEEFKRRGGGYSLQGTEIPQQGIVRHSELFKLPLSVGSSYCRTYGKDPDQQLDMGLCPYEAKGFFIIGGTRYILRLQEQLQFNKILVYWGQAYRAERTSQKQEVLQARMTYLTATGSGMIYMFVDEYQCLRCYIPFMERRYKGQKMEDYMFMPVLSILRILEPERSSRELLESIVALALPAEQEKIRQILQASLAVEFTIPDPVAYYIANTQAQILSGENARQFLVRRISETLYSYARELSLVERSYMFRIQALELARVAAKLRGPDNKNALTNKRLVTPADHVRQLLKSFLQKLFNEVQDDVNKNPNIDAAKAVKSIEEKAKNMNTKIRKAFSTGKWGADKEKAKSSVVMTLLVENPLTTWDEMKKVNIPVRDGDTKMELRSVDPWALRFICPMQTPEGGNCGLVKSLANLTSVSIESDDAIIRRYIRGELPGHTTRLSSLLQGNVMVLLNGKYLGHAPPSLAEEIRGLRRQSLINADVSIFIRDNFLIVNTSGSRPITPALIVKDNQLIVEQKNKWQADLSELLREGCMEYLDPAEAEQMVLAESIEDLQLTAAAKPHLEQEMNQLLAEIEQLKPRIAQVQAEMRNIKSTEQLKILHGGRMDPSVMKIAKLLRPEQTAKFSKVQIYDDPRYTENLQELMKFEQLETRYLQRRFQYNRLYAQKVQEGKDAPEFQARASYTHCEPDPAGLISISGNLINLLQDDQGARGTFQCKMNAQALSIVASNYAEMTDKSIKILGIARPAIVRTAMNKLLNLDKQSYLDFVIVAIMPLRGRNQEDSVVFNKSSIELGKFRSMKYMNFSATLATQTMKDNNSPDNFYDEFYRPLDRSGKPLDYLDDEGIPYMGAEVNAREILIGMRRVYPNDRDAQGNSRWEDRSIRTAVGEYGIIDRVSFINRGSKNASVIVKIRQYRIPQPGDKFALAHAQKFTISAIVSQEDLPFIESGPMKGRAPDIIINMHSIPSRMAVGMLQEILLTTLAVSIAKEIDASPFRPLNMNILRRALVLSGYHPAGLVQMTNGETGLPMSGQIMVGPSAALALKHNVEDKIQVSIAGGRRSSDTHQGVKGRKYGGKLRFGEMERDNVIGHSGAYILNDLFCKASDPFEVTVCMICNAVATTYLMPKEEGKTRENQTFCKVCSNRTDFGVAVVPFTMLSIIMHLGMANIRVFLKLKK